MSKKERAVAAITLALLGCLAIGALYMKSTGLRDDDVQHGSQWSLGIQAWNEAVPLNFNFGALGKVETKICEVNKIRYVMYDRKLPFQGELIQTHWGITTQAFLPMKSDAYSRLMVDDGSVEYCVLFDVSLKAPWQYNDELFWRDSGNGWRASELSMTNHGVLLKALVAKVACEAYAVYKRSKGGPDDGLDYNYYYCLLSLAKQCDVSWSPWFDIHDKAIQGKVDKYRSEHGLGPFDYATLEK